MAAEESSVELGRGKIKFPGEKFQAFQEAGAKVVVSRMKVPRQVLCRTKIK